MTKTNSMNMWVGGQDGGTFIFSSAFRVFATMGDFIDPGPSRTWVFLDEREDSINDSICVHSLSRSTPFGRSRSLISALPTFFLPQKLPNRTVSSGSNRTSKFQSIGPWSNIRDRAAVETYPIFFCRILQPWENESSSCSASPSV